jgi:prolyl 4-hydroxylase
MACALPQVERSVESMTITSTQQAMALARSGRPMEGLSILREAQAREEPEAFLLEGLWLLEGRFLPRDFTAARDGICAAAERGHVGAARTFAGLLACGVGGEIDWHGALATLKKWAERDPVAARQTKLIERMALDGEGRPDTRFSMDEVSSDPKIGRVEGFLTGDECALLIELSEPRMTRATIFHDSEQRFVEDPVRRSDRAGFPIVSEWPFIRAINLRIAAATETSVDCGEPLQVLRYGPTQEYRPHFDAIAGMANPRVLTALIWLNEDFSDGETRFDDLGIDERGNTGDLLVFSNTLADGAPDVRTRHSGAPVTSGVKYMASRWIRSQPPGPEGFGRHEIERA